MNSKVLATLYLYIACCFLFISNYIYINFLQHFNMISIYRISIFVVVSFKTYNCIIIYYIFDVWLVNANPCLNIVVNIFGKVIFITIEIKQCFCVQRRAAIQFQVHVMWFTVWRSVSGCLAWLLNCQQVTVSRESLCFHFGLSYIYI